MKCPYYVYFCIFMHLYQCDYNYVHVGGIAVSGSWGVTRGVARGGARGVAKGCRVELVTTFCPSVPFLPARPGAPWRQKKKRC